MPERSGARSDPSDVALRDQLSCLQALLVLSMQMTEGGDEGRILLLAASSVSSLGSGRLRGVYLFEEEWAANSGALDSAGRTQLEAQFAVLNQAGGPVAVPGERWSWAFPLRSVEGNFGYMVVSADAEPNPAEQFRLRVLAQQTGIALANARLHARERTSSQELRAANAELASTVAVLRRSTAIHDRLTQVAVSGEGQDGVAQAVHELTGYPVAIEDRHGNLRAWAGPERPTRYPKQAAPQREAVIHRALEAGQALRVGDRLLTVACSRNEVLAVLCLIDPGGECGEQGQVALEHGATVLAMELARLRSLAEAELRLRRDLVHELLAGADEASALGHAQALGYDLERPHRVVVVEALTKRADTDRVLQAVRRAARDQAVGSLVGVQGDHVVVLADAEGTWEKLRAGVCAELRGQRCRVGVGSLCLRPADFPRSCREALLALRIQAPSSNSDRAVCFDDLGVYRLLGGLDDPTPVQRFVAEWLGPLLDYDARKNSDLVTTLGCYLECGGSYDATAQALSVHRSTLKYRLQRIREISGRDLADPDVHFNLQLATRASKTLGALGDMAS
jgi:sugar diacid utilization regulator